MAGPDFSMKVTGADALLKTFTNYFKDVDESTFLIDAMKKIGVEIQGEARRTLGRKIYGLPQIGDYKRSGLLRANIGVSSKTIQHIDPPKHVGGGDWTVGSVSEMPVNKPIKIGDTLVTFVRAGQNYAAYIEFGTSKMKPRAFLLPALQNKSQRALQIINEALNKFLKAKVVK